ncbi:patatin-like phospholipase family protein [Chloroflexota bacterium]
MNKEYALALSGGGYRATLFSLGSLWRLNEFGLLAQLNRITSVSGSSIISAFLAKNWSKLKFIKGTTIFENFPMVIADPIRDFCSQGLDIKAGISGILSFRKSIGDKIAEEYAKRLFGSSTLQDIPDLNKGPEFIFYATSLQTGASVRITKKWISDYKVGEWPNPGISLAQVAGASSAFPPFLSPVTIECEPSDWGKTIGAFLYDQEKFRKNLVLTDGGVYDNLGLEAVWNDGFKNVFVCNASAPLKHKVNPRKNWVSQALHVTSIITDQTRALRKRTLIDNYLKKEYGGAYWGIRAKIDDYKLDDAMVMDNETTFYLQNIRTRLNAFSDEEQGLLINWGYALTDAALQRWYFTNRQPTGTWPIPEHALDR